MFKRVAVLSSSVISSLALLAGTAGAQECVQIMQYKYCL